MNDTITHNATTTNELIVKQLITAWTAQNKQLNNVMNKHDDNAWLKEVAPGRNRGIYIIGHLVAVHDNMLSLLGISEKLYPQLLEVFISNPDNASVKMPTITELKEYLEKVNTILDNYFSNAKPGELLDRHTKVSAEDFAKEPHRNKLSILISRTNHLAYHVGQLALLGNRELAN